MPGQHAPYYVKKRKNKYVVVNRDGEVKGTHDTRQEALDQQAALYVNVPGAKDEAEKRHKDKPKKKSSRDIAEQIAGLTTYLSGDEYRDVRAHLAAAARALPVDDDLGHVASVPCPNCQTDWHPSAFRCASCDTDFGDLPAVTQQKMRTLATRRR